MGNRQFLTPVPVVHVHLDLERVGDLGGHHRRLLLLLSGGGRPAAEEALDGHGLLVPERGGPAAQRGKINASKKCS